MFYLFGMISIYFSCELIKSSPLIDKKNLQKLDRMAQCLITLEHERLFDYQKVCQVLLNQENFEQFVYNLLYTILFGYILIREILKKEHVLSELYWCIANVSALVFAYIGELEVFQFSIDDKKSYTYTQKIILGILGIIITISLCRQIQNRKIKYKLIFKFILAQLFIYVILLSIYSNIHVHFHHAIVAGLLSLCYTDFNQKDEQYIHALLIGIVVQGFNFYSISEIFLFHVSDKKPPTFSLMLVIYGIYLLFWICANLLITRKNNIDECNLNMDSSFIRFNKPECEPQDHNNASNEVIYQFNNQKHNLTNVNDLEQELFKKGENEQKILGQYKDKEKEHNDY